MKVSNQVETVESERYADLQLNNQCIWHLDNLLSISPVSFIKFLSSLAIPNSYDSVKSLLIQL